MIALGDKVIVIRPEPNNIPFGAFLQGRGKVGKVGIVHEILLNCKSYGSECNAYKVYCDDLRYTWWFLECEIELLEPKYILPDGVYRCKCGATTTRKEGCCCDCKIVKMEKEKWSEFR